MGGPADRFVQIESTRRTELLQYMPDVVSLPYEIGTATDVEAPAQYFEDVAKNQDRPTTRLEELIGEVRSWILLDQNWDGEGAAKANPSSLVQAVDFLDVIPVTDLPDVTLFASGHTGVYWNEPNRYADLEFLGDGRIAYYIDDGQQGKHKGVVGFRPGEMPPLFAALLKITTDI